MSRHAAHGLSVELPAGWNGEIYRRREEDDEPERFGAASAERRRRQAQSGAILRAATVPIERDDGDFGGGIVQRLRTLDAFFVLFEYTVDEKLTPGEGLFASRRMPWPLRARDFSPNTLHTALPGHAGFQHFFTAGRRPFCLYAVVGSTQQLRRSVSQLNGVLSTVAIDAPE
jgi:hypothetical protein